VPFVDWLPKAKHNVRVGPPFALQTGSGQGDGEPETKRAGLGWSEPPTVGLVLEPGWRG
jgi:hypothetical protein